MAGNLSLARPGEAVTIPGPNLAIALLSLTRPRVLALVALAGYSGMVLAADGPPEAARAALCLAVLVVAAAGSVLLNAVLESGPDRRMARLSARSSALDRLGRRQAFNLGTVLVLAAAVMACGFLTPVSAALTVAAAAWYLLLYTMGHKRRSPFGAVTGGVPGALPALIGYGAVSPSLGPDGLMLFLLILLWQPPHFWSLALCRREEYRAAGFPVLPVSHGERFATVAILVYATSLLPVSLALWFLGGCSGAYALAAVVLGSACLAALVRCLILRPGYPAAFRATNWYLLCLLLAVILDRSIR